MPKLPYKSNNQLSGDTLLDRYNNIINVTKGNPNALALQSTDIKIMIDGGLAKVVTSRVFGSNEAIDRAARSSGSTSIEATITFPVPIDAVVTDLVLEIDGRMVKAVAKAKQEARDTYEAALDSGNKAVLHEELLRGIHAISVGHISLGQKVSVHSTYLQLVNPINSEEATLRLPVTVGNIYGVSPLTDADDLIVSSDNHIAKIEVHTDLDNKGLKISGNIHQRTKQKNKANLYLDAPVDLKFNWKARPISGLAANGSLLTLNFHPLEFNSGAVQADILFDISGSMEGKYSHNSSTSKLDLAREALESALLKVRSGQFGLYKFNDRCEFVVEGTAQDVIAAVSNLKTSGGTEIGLAFDKLFACNRDNNRDIVLITDGKSWNIDVNKIASHGRRIHVVLIGDGALEANVGHLAALSGGLLFYSCNEYLSHQIALIFSASTIQALSNYKKRKNGQPLLINRAIGSMAIEAHWDDAATQIIGNISDRSAKKTRQSSAKSLVHGASEINLNHDVAKMAAWLAFPYVDQAAALAEAENLCTHLTSLVLVDEASERHDSLPHHVKVPLSAPKSEMIFVSSASSMLAVANYANSSGGVLRSAGIGQSMLIAPNSEHRLSGDPIWSYQAGDALANLGLGDQMNIDNLSNLYDSDRGKPSIRRARKDSQQNTPAISSWGGYDNEIAKLASFINPDTDANELAAGKMNKAAAKAASSLVAYINANEQFQIDERILLIVVLLFMYRSKPSRQIRRILNRLSSGYINSELPNQVDKILLKIGIDAKTCLAATA